ncbi:MAG: prepilin-type N-terminal cleavage/methylation domain-containing protein [Opitutaceae bacterium]|nr:prepilin-type N-terminal cleavage/methylation domain-containing protein [Opitutaceae bacterium]
MRVAERRISRGEASGFSLLEVVVVLGLIGVLAALLCGQLRDQSGAALRSGQATLAGLVLLARTQAQAAGRPARLLVQADAGAADRFLRCLAVQAQETAGWRTLAVARLPAEVRVVPGDFPDLPAGLMGTGESADWRRADGSRLRSSALPAGQRVLVAVDTPDPEYWATCTFSPAGTTFQSGDLVLASARLRPPSAGSGDSPVVLGPPDTVRGLSLSAYGVPAPIDSREGF